MISFRLTCYDFQAKNEEISVHYSIVIIRKLKTRILFEFKFSILAEFDQM